jgi:hypothetical protein
MFPQQMEIAIEYTKTPKAGILYAKLYRKVKRSTREFVCYQLLADTVPTFTIATAQHISLLSLPDDIEPDSLAARDIVLDPTLNRR